MALAVAWAWLFVDVRCAWAAEDQATIPAKVGMFQEYRVTTSGLQNTFEYLIVPEEEGAPLPLDADGKAITSFTLTRDQQLWMEFPVPVAISPTAERITYHYVLKPAKTTLPDGLYYVDVLSPNLVPGINVYYLDIDVVLSSVDATLALVVPTVHVESWDGPKVTDPGWRIAYKRPSGGETPKQASGSGKSSGGSLSKTGDPYNAELVRELAINGVALLLLGLFFWRRRKRGECHA